jgi:hypothetical protein
MSYIKSQVYKSTQYIQSLMQSKIASSGGMLFSSDQIKYPSELYVCIYLDIDMQRRIY